MENNVDTILDAFIALRDVDDQLDVSEPVIKKVNRKVVTEGRSFNISGANSSDLESAQEFLDEDDGDIELEVIDPNADTLAHLKDKKEYIGQYILSCNRCGAKKFIDSTELQASEANPEIYNLEDECPNPSCGSKGTGYTLLGQVGKVTNDSEQPIVDDNDEPETPEEEIEIENDQATEEDDVKFDNDIEDEETTEEEVDTEEETSEEENSDVETSEEDNEKDDLETDSSEDEEDDLDLPELGDEVEESLNEDEDSDQSYFKDFLKSSINKYGEEAWLMNKVITALGDDDVYYNRWVDSWVDECSRKDCDEYFGTPEDLEELKKDFIKIYSDPDIHAEGLDNADEETLAYAHKIDSLLGLKPIRNTVEVKEALEETDDVEEEEEVEIPLVADLFTSILEPEKLEDIVVISKEDDETETLYEGNFEEMPDEIAELTFDSFNVGKGNLVCNVDSENVDADNTLKDFLEFFNDEETEKISVVDVASSEEVFTGTKKDVIEQFGDVEFVSIENPERLEISVVADEFDSDDDSEPEEDEEDEVTEEDDLVEAIIKENGLATYRIKNLKATEYWINESIKTKEDLDVIYEKFIHNRSNNLVNNFKAITGYRDVVDEAMETLNGISVAYHLNEDVDQSVVKDFINYANSELPVDFSVNYDKSTGKFAVWHKRLFVGKTKVDLSSFENALEQLYEVIPDSLFEACNKKEKDEISESDVISRQAFNSFMKWYDSLAYKDQCKIDDKADEEGLPLYNDCTESELAMLHDWFVNSNNVEEVFESFATRKELSSAITKCQNNNKPYTVRRSIKEGFRYDLVTKKEVNEAFNLIPADESEEDVESVEGVVLPKEQNVVPVNSEEKAIVTEGPEAEVVRKIMRISKDISDALKSHYDIDAQPALIFADMIQDLKLISGDIDVSELADTPMNNATKVLFNDYNQAYELIDSMMSTFTGVEFHSTPESKIKAAIAMLDQPCFSKPAIEKGIGSPRFLQAARAGAVPYIQNSDVPMLESCKSKVNEDVEEGQNFIITAEVLYDTLDNVGINDGEDAFLDKATIDQLMEDGYVRDDAIYLPEGTEFTYVDQTGGPSGFIYIRLNDSGIVLPWNKTFLQELEDASDFKFNESFEDDPKYDPNLVNPDDEANDYIDSQERDLSFENEDEDDINVDLDIELFDKDINDYFMEAYEEPRHYYTESGTVDEKGNIILEGYVCGYDDDSHITFTLTPEQKLTEDLNPSDVKVKLDDTVNFIVKNNLSDEVFNFKFANNTADEEIFKFYEGNKEDVIKAFTDACSGEYDRSNWVDAAAEFEFNRNKEFYQNHGFDVSHVKNALLVCDEPVKE